MKPKDDKLCNGRTIAVGFPRWRAYSLKPILSLNPDQIFFVRDAAAAERMMPTPADRLACWGGWFPTEIEALAQRTGARPVRIEDGFIRSVGLGSELIRPWSLVFDERGIYFDPTRVSDLEHILQDESFSSSEIEEARWARAFIVEHGITKYNLERRDQACWHTGGRPVVFVPGQVEDDASIRYGCGKVRTNLDLLRVVRECRPEAFIVYKPHPDVTSGNRRSGRVRIEEARRFADHVETELSAVSCLDACDEVHTMTSLVGFDALLRGKRVVTYGEPFYAGWGLTEDKSQEGVALSRRRRRLTLDELVAGALLRYPTYWDWELWGYTTCRAVLNRIVEMRNALEASGEIEKLRRGFLRRQGRIVGGFLRTWWDNVVTTR